jgi:putative redox protein
MALEMTVQAKLETGLSFDVETGSGFHIVLDTPPSNEEQARGPSPMEMLQVFVEITVEHILTGHNIQPEAVQRAIDLTEGRYCGVSATLSRTAKMHMTFRIVEAQPA